MGPLWPPQGEVRLFLQDAGVGARTGEVSISSPRRATAGIRISIDRDLGPLFALNAVSAVPGLGGRCSEGRARPVNQRAIAILSPDGPKYLWDRERAPHAPRGRGDVRITEKPVIGTEHRDLGSGWLWCTCGAGNAPCHPKGRRRCEQAFGEQILRVSEGPVMGASHSATKAFAKAATTMAKVDLWHARLAIKTLCRDQREAIPEVAED